MKKYFVVNLMVALTISLASSAQEGKASLSLKKNSFDFGSIKEEQGVVNTTFEFNNTGKTPLVIHRVITSCDCAVVDWPKEPIAPGLNGTFKVAFNPKGRIGKFEKLITIYSNAEIPTSVLRITGIVLERPKTIEDIYNRVVGNFRFKNVHAAFGRTYNNEIKTDSIDFVYTGSEPVKVGAKFTNLPFLKVIFVPEFLKANEKGVMIITFDASSKNDWGYFSDRFTLTQDGKDISGSIITVSATIEEDFTKLNDNQRINAPKIDMPIQNFDFGEVLDGDVIEKDFEFNNIGKSDLIIRKIKASCGCTTVEPADKVIKPGKSSSVKASVKTSGFTGRIAKTITIITNDPVNPSVVIRMTATVLPKNK